MWYTVFYTVRVGYAGTMGCLTHVKTSTKTGLEQALNKKGICITQVAAVIEGKHKSITKDWSKL